MTETPSPSPEQIEVTNEHERQPLNFAELAAGNIDILMLGENHFHTALFDAIAQNASVLRAAGIRAFLTETSSSQDFSDVNAGDFTRLDSGELEAGPTLKTIDPAISRELGGQDPPTEARNRMVKALVAQGIDIVPIDSPEYHEQMKARFDGGVSPSWDKIRQREEVDMAENVDAAVATYGKVALLIGESHTRKGIQTSIHGKQFKQIAQIAAERGHLVRTVQFHGAEAFRDQASIRLYLEAARLEATQFMYRPKEGDPLAAGEPDWVAYIHPAEFEKEFA